MTPTPGESCYRIWPGGSGVGATRTRMLAAGTTGVKPAAFTPAVGNFLRDSIFMSLLLLTSDYKN